jgi:ABC-type transporter Mla MlaB component
VPDGECIELDLRGVSFVDVRGYAALRALVAELQGRGGHLALTGAPSCIRRIEQLLGVGEGDSGSVSLERPRVQVAAAPS